VLLCALCLYFVVLLIDFLKRTVGVQDTFDESGRRVRKARVKAENKIAEHAEWVTNNPYRMPVPGQPREREGDGAATDDEDASEPNGTQFNTGSAAPSISGAVPGRSTADDDDEGVILSDGVRPSHCLQISVVS
jgi:hypothetical protein